MENSDKWTEVQARSPGTSKHLCYGGNLTRFWRNQAKHDNFCLCFCSASSIGHPSHGKAVPWKNQETKARTTKKLKTTTTRADWTEKLANGTCSLMVSLATDRLMLVMREPKILLWGLWRHSTRRAQLYEPKPSLKVSGSCIITS